MMPAIPARDNCGLGDPYSTADGIATDMVVPGHLLDGATLVPGALAVLADSAVGFAVIGSLGRPTAMATSHLHLDVVRPFIATDHARLRCTGHLVHDDGGHYALGQGSIVDDAGHLIATATVGAVLMPFRTIRPPDEAAPAATPPATTAQQWADIDEFLGSAPSASDSGTSMTFVAGPSVANTAGGLHGGIGVLMAERTLHHALEREAPGQFTLVELHATYPRPIASNGAAIECRATVTYRGRRLATARGELLDQRGKVAVVVDATYIGTDTGLTLASS